MWFTLLILASSSLIFTGVAKVNDEKYGHTVNKLALWVYDIPHLSGWCFGILAVVLLLLKGIIALSNWGMAHNIDATTVMNWINN